MGVDAVETTKARDWTTIRMVVMLTMTLGFFFVRFFVATICGHGRFSKCSNKMLKVEIVVGYACNSMALVADSFHMLSDVLALMIATACLRVGRPDFQGHFLNLQIARRPSSNISNTFGWRRAEVLGALINAVFLLALCFSIFVEALKRLIEPEEIKDPKFLLVAGVIGLLVTIIGIFLFHGVLDKSIAPFLPLTIRTRDHARALARTGTGGRRGADARLDERRRAHGALCRHHARSHAVALGGRCRDE